MENKISEKQMNAFLKDGDYQGFLNAFNLYLCAIETTQQTLYYKAIALLYYLSSKDLASYNKLVQTISIEEINNEFIEVVLNVNDSINRFDLESLKNILKKCPSGLKPLVEIVAKNQRESIQNNLNKDAGDADVLTVSSTNVIDSLKDCVEVVKNFMGN